MPPSQLLHSLSSHFTLFTKSHSLTLSLSLFNFKQFSCGNNYHARLAPSVEAWPHTARLVLLIIMLFGAREGACQTAWKRTCRVSSDLGNVVLCDKSNAAFRSMKKRLLNPIGQWQLPRHVSWNTNGTFLAPMIVQPKSNPFVIYIILRLSVTKDTTSLSFTYIFY